LIAGYAGRMTGTWLTADEQRAWRTYLRVNSLLPAQLNRQLQHDSGLTLPEYEVLVQLSEATEQRLRPFQICEALNWEQSRLSHQLTRMQQRGLIVREECEADGRGALVVLTAPGAEAIHSAAPGHVAAVRRLIFDRLDDDQRAAFEQACATIIEGLTESPTELAREQPRLNWAAGRPGARPGLLACPAIRTGRCPDSPRCPGSPRCPDSLR
jgi:DNA-binding MarR family transcriptional regulator